VVVELHALEGVPTDQPHVVVVGEHDAFEPPLVRTVLDACEPVVAIGGERADDAEESSW
jgi:hypothetical protein